MHLLFINICLGYLVPPLYFPSSSHLDLVHFCKKYQAALLKEYLKVHLPFNQKFKLFLSMVITDMFGVLSFYTVSYLPGYLSPSLNIS